MPNFSDEIQDKAVSNTEKNEIRANNNTFRGLNKHAIRALKGSKMIVQDIDPARCKPWKYHNRDKAWLTKERCIDLITSIQQCGQNDPVLLRELRGDPNYDFEIIYGVRRWYACSQIEGQKLLANVVDIDDKICMILMHAENACSKDISEFERAYSFAQQMKSGVFRNQSEMADAMGLTQGTISKMINAAEIFENEWIQGLFNNKLEIPIKYAYELSVLLKNSNHYEVIMKEAEAIKRKRALTGVYLGSTSILKRLIESTKLESKDTTDSVILFAGDKPVIFWRKDKEGKICIFIDDEVKTLNRSEVEAACLKALGDHVFGLFPDE